MGHEDVSLDDQEVTPYLLALAQRPLANRAAYHYLASSSVKLFVVDSTIIAILGDFVLKRQLPLYADRIPTSLSIPEIRRSCILETDV